MPSFSKEERLCSHLFFEDLLKNGSSSLVYPFKIIRTKKKLTGKFPVQIGISVPKRNFKRAVDRNRIKRMIREAYRLNKNILYQFLDSEVENYILLFIYLPKTELEYKEIEKKIILSLNRLTEEIKKDRTSLLVDEKVIKADGGLGGVRHE